jgi:hypothetical protein
VSAPAQVRSVSRLIYEIRSFPNVRPEWDKLSTDEKRIVLSELDGDITPAWALQVIKDIKRASKDQ